ncbi:helix-turn-helix domain-containing protein [Candidatus Poribacteria bacterium]|nr:helix-turn-helix domain-containing protein [Candidatus Poribacteria bacterium]
MDIIKCGENLKRARKKKGWSQKLFAEQLGQSESYATSISSWETGKESVPKKHREKVASELEISESEFVPTIGHIYLFYYPDAESEQSNTYPCKIGKTDQSVEHRVKSQKGEWQYDEMPKIALCLPVPIDNDEAWEKIIHGVLKLYGRWIDPDKAELLCLKGQEWFYTSPDEVKSIYEEIKHRLTKPILHQCKTTC